MSQNVSASNLKDSIAQFTAGVAKHAPAEVITTLGVEIEKLAKSGIVAKALQVGVKAPQFSLPEARGGEVSLATLLAKGPAIVTFYRGGWCPFCDLQLRAYQAILPQIHDAGAELVAISMQTSEHALSDIEKKQLTFPVATDAHGEVSQQYGLVFKLSETLQKLQAGFGDPLPKFNGDDSWNLVTPGTFVIDRTGIVRTAHVDVDWMKRLEPAAILESLAHLKS